MIVKITGWKEGFAKVEFNKWLRIYSGLTIGEAKICVDGILKNKETKITVNNLPYRSTVDALTKMKLVYEVQE